jgi:CheY-like chemotaxis protein
MLRKAKEAQSPFKLAILDMQMPGMNGAELGRVIKEDAALSDTVLVLLTAMGERGDARKMQQLGFAGYLTKPIRATQLYDAVVEVMSGQQAAEGKLPYGMPEIVTQYSIRETKKLRIRILVAEDNPINQSVALHMLEKAGYRADAVANGKEAVDALEKIPYDLVLMDVQMPEMDGFEATGFIRAKEKNTTTHIPIIAMTAYAMEGDQERCLEAGMDDYVPKPIRPKQLFEVLDRWIRRRTYIPPR